MVLLSLAVSDDHEKRFKSYGWDYIKINGHNYKEISKALKKAQKSKKPIAISCKTTIGLDLQIKVVKLHLMEVLWVKMK